MLAKAVGNMDEGGWRPLPSGPQGVGFGPFPVQTLLHIHIYKCGGLTLPELSETMTGFLCYFCF